ncbi:MAG TPA: quercetin 2,3-dioxygenase [Mycobacterium sp.]|nr:quercetin 2,3-dioxygenase [Mycobacterium sp.]
MSVPHIARATTHQRIAWLGGSVHHVVLDAAETDGRLAMFRSSMQGGAASPVHVHDREDETVFVLEGQGTFWAGDQRWKLGSGDTAFLPRGVPHTYLFTSDTAEIITVCNPAGMEEFFRAAGWDLSSPQPHDWAVDTTTLRKAAEACGQRVLGPPLRPDDEMPASYLREGDVVSRPSG